MILSQEQDAVALDILKGKNLCVTGDAGTGKSFLLNHLRKEISLSVTASTGISALHVGGSTVHSWAGLGVGKKSADQIIEELVEKEDRWGDRTLKRLIHTDRLVVDEVSMLDADIVDLLSEVMQIARESEEPFGGCQVIFFGDFLQLPPVCKKGKPRFAFESDAWLDALIEVRLLTKVFRQEDETFSRILNKIRFGEIDDSVEEFLLSRFQAEDTDPDNEPCMLHSHNLGCAGLNKNRLRKLPGDETVLQAKDFYKQPFFKKQLNQNCLAPEELSLKVGARVMLLINMDLALGLVNGSMGTVTSLDPLLVNFDSGAERVLIEKKTWELVKGDETVARREQFPLRLSWAMTIHKSQGMTLEKVSADLGRCFADGQSYVAISRVKTAEGLFLTGNSCQIEANPKAVAFYKAHVL